MSSVCLPGPMIVYAARNRHTDQAPLWQGQNPTTPVVIMMITIMMMMMMTMMMMMAMITMMMISNEHRLKALTQRRSENICAAATMEKNCGRVNMSQVSMLILS